MEPLIIKMIRLNLMLVLALALGACKLAAPAAGAPPATLAAAPLSWPSSGQPTAAAQTEATAEEAAQSSPAQPADTATPAPVSSAPQLRPLTSGGCCAQPFWSPDSQRVFYLDKPAPDAPTGIWGVDLNGGAPALFTDRLGVYSPDLSRRAFPEGGQTVVERLGDGQRWIIPNGGRAVTFSPDGAWVAWTSGSGSGALDSIRRQVWISRSDGGGARQVIETTGGGLSGWLADGRLLVNGRLAAPESGAALWAVSLPADPGAPPAVQELGRAERLRGVSVSPGGGWLVYLATFSGDPQQDGLWLVSTASGERRRLELFGAYRWRDQERLLIVPLDLGQEGQRLWQVDAASGAVQPLTDPAVTPFKIGNGDWSVSPDGRHIAFVSAHDQNIWLISLAD